MWQVVCSLDGATCFPEARAVGEEVACRGVKLVAVRALRTFVVVRPPTGRCADGTASPEKQKLFLVVAKRVAPGSPFGVGLSGHVDVVLTMAVVSRGWECLEKASALDVTEQVLAKLGGGPEGAWRELLVF